MILTPEQLCIVYSDADTIFVEALAGTGKTTTLKEYAKARPCEKILYLVFNKSVRAESKAKFPKNVEVHTINSFVYAKMMKLNTNPIMNELSTSFVMRFFRFQQHEYARAVKIIECCNAFVNSSVPFELFFDSDNTFILDAKKLVSQMYNDTEFPITHGILLKRFVDEFNFASLDYDSVLVDEAQDLNGAMFHIINKIPGKKVYVGDDRQAIYGFRNTINIFRQDIKAERFKLTNSYRFGPVIANFVNTMSGIMYHKPLGIKGVNEDEIGEIVLDEQENMEGLYSAYITRTNAHLFDKAFELMKEGKKVSIPFDWDLIKELLLDVFYLYFNVRERIVTSTIRAYPSFDYMKKISKAGGDIELAFLIKVVEKYELELPENIISLHNHLTSPKLADIILLTAHKAKGLEFFNVEIANDFALIKHAEAEEKNLLYVAMTRVIEKLKPNADLRNTFLNLSLMSPAGSRVVAI
ncbi:UvrD-helicase domain-containing protein [Campylobacter sp. MOP7]|uniref:UvrD-helicase domain-containing protein n=1 Tax=Campylobacter canis TaxID=3378588 RepID=UPI00387E6CF2